MSYNKELELRAYEQSQGDQRLVVIDLMRRRPDSRPRGSLLERVGYSGGLLAVAVLLGVPFEALSNVTPRDVWPLLFLGWAYSSFKLYDYVTDGLVEKLELLMTHHEAVVISSKVGEAGRVRYDQLSELIVFDDEWYYGSRVFHWRGVIFEVRGELPLELELGDQTEHAARLISRRSGVKLKRERIVWPAVPDFD